MIDPYVPRTKDGYRITIRLPPVANMRGARPNISVPRRFTVVNVHVVDDDIAHILQRDASVPRDLHIGTTPIYGLVVVDNQLVLELDDHVVLERDPEGLVLDDSITKGARGRTDCVVIRGIRHLIETAPFASHRTLAEPNSAVSQALPVISPVRVASPAVIYGVPSQAL